MPDDGDLILQVAGKKLGGWKDVRVTRGIERVPGDFEVSVTERSPGDITGVVAKPGDPVEVRIGADVVITGYVDQLENAATSQDHTVTIRGRGKCQDLVDCAAEWPGAQIPSSTVGQVCTKLCAFYNITVRALVDTGKPIPLFALIHGETVFEIVDRICRYRGILAFEDEQGALVLTHAGTERAASGFVLGKNVLEATAYFRMNESYSDYWAYAQAIDIFADKGNFADQPYHLTDPGVPRHRVMAIVAESSEGGFAVTKTRALWERNRRRAGQQFAKIKADSWRDKAGKLWRPNTLAPVSLPELKIDGVTWLIGEVTYRRGEDGTSCEVWWLMMGQYKPCRSRLAISKPRMACRAWWSSA